MIERRDVLRVEDAIFDLLTNTDDGWMLLPPADPEHERAWRYKALKLRDILDDALTDKPAEASPAFRRRVDELRKEGLDLDAAWICASRERGESPPMPKPCRGCAEKKRRR